MSPGDQDFICNGPTTFGDRTNARCLAQSFFVIIGGLSNFLFLYLCFRNCSCELTLVVYLGNTFYFVVIAVNLFLMLSFDYVAGWKGFAHCLLINRVVVIDFLPQKSSSHK